jgi:hypothetical protein
MVVGRQRHAPAALYPRERTPSTHCTGGWVGPRAGLDTEARGKVLVLLRGMQTRSHGHPVRSQTLYWLSYPGSIALCIEGIICEAVLNTTLRHLFKVQISILVLSSEHTKLHRHYGASSLNKFRIIYLYIRLSLFHCPIITFSWVSYATARSEYRTGLVSVMQHAVHWPLTMF